MDEESRDSRQRDFGWVWSILGLLVVALFGTAIWFRRPPSDSVELRAVEEIKAQLNVERFVNTNSVRFKTTTVIFMIPVSTILGTDLNGVQDTFVRDGAQLGLNYDVKGGRAFNFTLPTDLAHVEGARKIAEDLAKLNPTVAVTISTNQMP